MVYFALFAKYRLHGAPFGARVHIINSCLNGMAWWPGNERDNVFTTAKRHDQVKDQARNNLILEQGLIGAATLVEKNTRLDWAFATTENQHSIGDAGSIVHLSMLINAVDHRFLHEYIDSRKTG